MAFFVHFNILMRSLILSLENNFFFALHFLSIIIPVLLVIAFFTVGERKLMAAVQRRKGPDVAGF